MKSDRNASCITDTCSSNCCVGHVCHLWHNSRTPIPVLSMSTLVWLLFFMELRLPVEKTSIVLSHMSFAFNEAVMFLMASSKQATMPAIIRECRIIQYTYNKVDQVFEIPVKENRQSKLTRQFLYEWFNPHRFF